MAENFANNARSELAETITAGHTTFTVKSAASFPAPNFRIIIDDEIMLVTGVSGTTFTVTRGAESTVAQAHGAGADVIHVITAAGIQAILGALELPAGGTAGQVLSKIDGTDYNVEWDDPATPAGLLPTGGSAGQVLAKINGTNYNTQWVTPQTYLTSPSTTVQASASTSYTVLDADMDKYTRFTAAGAKQ